MAYIGVGVLSIIAVSVLMILFRQSHHKVTLRQEIRDDKISIYLNNVRIFHTNLEIEEDIHIRYRSVDLRNGHVESVEVTYNET